MEKAQQLETSLPWGDLTQERKGIILAFFNKKNVPMDAVKNATLLYYLNEFIEAKVEERQLMLNWLPMDLEEKTKEIIKEFADFCGESGILKSFTFTSKEKNLPNVTQETENSIQKIISEPNKSRESMENNSNLKTFKSWLETLPEGDIDEILELPELKGSENPLRRGARGLRKMVNLESRENFLKGDSALEELLKNWHKQKYLSKEVS